MKQFFFTFMVLVLTANGTGQSTCVTCVDTTPADTALYRRVYKEVAPMVDSIVKEAKSKVDDARTTRDSLSVVVDSLYNDAFKKEATLKVDTWRSPDNVLHRWSWRFWIYPNGDTLYYRVIKKKK